MRAVLLLVVSSAVALAAPSSFADPPSFTPRFHVPGHGHAPGPILIDLGTPPGTEWSTAVAVNSFGQVVGFASPPPPHDQEFRAFSWTRAGGFVDLGTLPGCTSTNPVAVNDLGEVVGTCYPADSYVPRAFSWTPAGGMVDLGRLGGEESNGTYTADINRFGQVVGTSGAYAFLWTRSGGMRDLGVLPGYVAASAAAINDSGQVIGQVYDPNGNHRRAFSWTRREGMVDLGTLPLATMSWAVAVNRFGQVVGYSGNEDPGASTHRAFFWSRAGGMVDLGAPEGSDSAALDINSFGEVVGTSTTTDGETHAFLWTRAGGMVELGGPVWSATLLNDFGQVIGHGQSPATGRWVPFLWTERGGWVELGTLGGYKSHAEAMNERYAVGYSTTETGSHAVLWVLNPR